MPLSTHRLAPPPLLPGREPLRHLPQRSVVITEPRNAQELLDGVEVSDSTWGEWEQLAIASGAHHA